MSVTLTPQAEALVREKVERGLYASTEDVIDKALRLLDLEDRQRWLRAALAKGEVGEGIEYTPEYMQQVWQRAIESARLGRPIRDDVKP